MILCFISYFSYFYLKLSKSSARTLQMMRDTTKTEFDANGATYRLVLSTLTRQRTQLGPTATEFLCSTQVRCMLFILFPYCGDRSLSGYCGSVWLCGAASENPLRIPIRIQLIRQIKQHRDFERARGLSGMAGAGESERARRLSGTMGLASFFTIHLQFTHTK